MILSSGVRYQMIKSGASVSYSRSFDAISTHLQGERRTPHTPKYVGSRRCLSCL